METPSQKFTTTLRCVLLASLIMLHFSSFCQNRNIESVEKLNLGGVEQQIFIRGKDSSKPILLIIHGGPGFSEAALYRTYNKDLENYFIVVNWDQRGTNLSYNDSIDKNSMNFDQIVSDAHQLVSVLKTRFNKDKIFLMGHSAGTVIGIKYSSEYPEDLYAYIGIGQVVNGMLNEKQSLAYTIKMAQKERNRKAIEELNEVQKNYPSNASGSLKYLYRQRKWLEKFNGVFYPGMNYASLFKGITKTERSLHNDTLSAKGEKFSMENLWDDFLSIDFFSSNETFQIPVYFVMGKYDYNTPITLARKYFNTISAPRKRFFAFEKSAHFVPFEEPAKFNKLISGMIRDEALNFRKNIGQNK